MITYPDDNYDDKYVVNIDFIKKYKDPEYSMWLEKVLLEVMNKDKVTDAFSVESKIKKLGIETTYLDDLCITIEDKRIREERQLLKDYPLNVVDPYPASTEELRAVNEWEIHFVAKLVKEFTKKTEGVVKSQDYKKFLDKLYPYKNYLLKRTFNRLSEKSISTYLSVRINKQIEWYNCSEDNIAYDLNYLMWADIKNERFLDIDTDLNTEYWRNLSLLG